MSAAIETVAPSAAPAADTRDLRAPASVDPDGAVTALYYQDQIAALADGQEGTFSPAGRDEASGRAGSSTTRWRRSGRPTTSG